MQGSIVSTVLQLVPYVVSIVRFYCTSTGPIGGLNCEVLLQEMYDASTSRWKWLLQRGKCSCIIHAQL